MECACWLGKYKTIWAKSLETKSVSSNVFTEIWWTCRRAHIIPSSKVVNWAYVSQAFLTISNTEAQMLLLEHSQTHASHYAKCSTWTTVKHNFTRREHVQQHHFTTCTYQTSKFCIYRAHCCHHLMCPAACRISFRNRWRIKASRKQPHLVSVIRNRAPQRADWRYKWPRCLCY